MATLLPELSQLVSEYEGAFRVHSDGFSIITQDKWNYCQSISLPSPPTPGLWRALYYPVYYGKGMTCMCFLLYQDRYDLSTLPSIEIKMESLLYMSDEPYNIIISNSKNNIVASYAVQATLPRSVYYSDKVVALLMFRKHIEERVQRAISSYYMDKLQEKTMADIKAALPGHKVYPGADKGTIDIDITDEDRELFPDLYYGEKGSLGLHIIRIFYDEVKEISVSKSFKVKHRDFSCDNCALGNIIKEYHRQWARLMSDPLNDAAIFQHYLREVEKVEGRDADTNWFKYKID